VQQQVVPLSAAAKIPAAPPAPPAPSGPDAKGDGDKDEQEEGRGANDNLRQLFRTAHARHLAV
jgi:hypothetical protein